MGPYGTRESTKRMSAAEATDLRFDTAHLAKGDVVTAQTIELATGTSRRADYRKFSFAKMGVQEQIERERQDLICASDGEGLAILTDAQAHEHLAGLIRRYERGIRKSSRKRARIVRDGFTDAMKRAADVEDRRAAGAALALRRNSRAHARMKP